MSASSPSGRISPNGRARDRKQIPIGHRFPDEPAQSGELGDIIGARRALAHSQPAIAPRATGEQLEHRDEDRLPATTVKGGARIAGGPRRALVLAAEPIGRLWRGHDPEILAAGAALLVR